MPFPERLETERLVLRRWREDDAADFAAIWADPTVWAALMPGRPADPGFADERFRNHLAHWEAHGFGLWAVEERAGGRVAGWVGPSHPDFAPGLAREVEVGWSLREPFRGRGLATEGARAAVAASFEHLGREEVISLIAPANAPSIAVAERLAMRERGRVETPGTGIELRIYRLARRRM